MEEDELLEDFTILINAWVSLDERQVNQLAESLCKVARSKSQKSAIPIVSEWVAVDERLPDHLQTVWLSNGKGWTTLGCRAVYDYEGNWCWAEHNGVIYQDENKIVAECDNEDLDVKFWMALPEPPCR